ncbi:hypothetical protein FAI41_07895 [Acetobacteraceae bacterium]|nr:hypothetical protein FAI41_07895 [Acetobacteraceae bacterium]
MAFQKLFWWKRTGIFLVPCALMLALPAKALIIPQSPEESPSTPFSSAEEESLPGIHPTLSPSKDAEIVYRFHVKGKSEPHEVKVLFSGSGDKLRIEQLDSVGITILDRPGQKVYYLNKERHFYLGMRPLHGLRSPFFLDLEMHYVPKGAKKIANVTCREWDITSKYGHANACVTEDGLILQQEGADSEGTSGKLEALSVSYHPLPPSSFDIPSDYHNIRAPKTDVPGVAQTPNEKND